MAVKSSWLVLCIFYTTPDRKLPCQLQLRYQHNALRSQMFQHSKVGSTRGYNVKVLLTVKT